MMSQELLNWTLFGHVPQMVGLEYVFGIAVSLLVGSFLNVVVYRLPIMMDREWRAMVEEASKSEEGIPDAQGIHSTHSDEGVFNLAVPRSACPHCQHQIAWYENIPVLSYVFLRGKCSECQSPISLRYPMVELTMGILGALIVYLVGFSVTGLALLLFVSAMVTLALIDLDHMILPDSITLPFIWLGMAFHLLHILPNITVEQSLIGAMLGYLSLWSVYWVYKLVRHREGLGYGDFKLLAVVGAWGGAFILPQVILIAAPLFLAGTLYVHFFKGGWDAQRAAPFGPSLAIGGIAMVLWGYI